MKIAVFYHVYAVNNWNEIFAEQFNKMIKSKLISSAEKVFINVCKNEIAYKAIQEIATNHFNNIEVLFTEKNLFEYSTLKLLQDYCKENECYVLYCHTKGVANQTFKENQEATRNYLDYFNIENWNDCIEILNDNYDCCGVNWWGDMPEPHFSGNYWWANSEYINTLEALPEPIFEGRSDADIQITQRCFYEKWVGTGNNIKAFSFCQNSKAFYLTKIERKDYEKV